MLQAEGYTCQEITFSGSVNINQIGHAVLHIDKFDEDYLIPLPNVKVKGLLSGTPYPELHGTYNITSSTGFTSEIDFSGKGLFSGKKNSFHASLYRSEDKKHLLYTVEGQWNDTFTFHDVANKQDIETFDTNAEQAAPLDVADLSQQDPWESRKAWAGVIDALNRGDMQGTSDAKSRVEEAQRRLRKEEGSKGVQWQQAFFSKTDDDPLFDKLAASTGEKLQADTTVGVWKFDRQKAQNAKKPYHGELTPIG